MSPQTHPSEAAAPWLLTHRDFSAYRPGHPPPRLHYRQFECRNDAVIELNLLRDEVGSELAGAVLPSRPKSPPPTPPDFGFPPRGKRRLTP